MDPYLEAPHFWRGVHLLLLAEFAALLQPQLNALGYFVDVQEQVYLGDTGREIIPDGVIHETTFDKLNSPHPATAVVDEPVRVAQLREERVPFLEIASIAERRVVTVIELFSPTNKFRADGRTQYSRKRRELEQDAISLVEIDLLRGGRPLVDLPEHLLADHPHAWLVNIIRTHSTDGSFYPIRLRDRLPRIRIPLSAEAPDAVLDLQTAFTVAYDRGPYDIRIDYTADPPPPHDDLDWIDALLKAQGLR